MHQALKTGPLCSYNLKPVQGSTIPLLKIQMAPRFILLMSSAPKQREPSCTCLSEAKASHSRRVWVEVSSSAPHLLHKGKFVSSIKWRFLLRVLGPVRRLITTPDCVLLKDKLMYSFKYNQKDATSYNILYCCQCSTCFRRFFHPSSGAQTVHTTSGMCQVCFLLPLACVSWQCQLTHAICSSGKKEGCSCLLQSKSHLACEPILFVS
jgi:hypothetical protein